MVRAALLTRTTRLWVEFAALYFALPLAFALLVPTGHFWSALAVMLAVATLLLALTPGYRWRSLWRGGTRGLLLPAAGFAVLLAPAAVALPLLLRPETLFWLPLRQPMLWLAIMVLYPLLSAFPQELAFRALFFERYGCLLPNRTKALLTNGFVFGLAHLFLWNLPAILFSALGGVVFAWAYRERGSFLLAWLLHSLAGAALFTTGAGVFFYHGAVG